MQWLWATVSNASWRPSKTRLESARLCCRSRSPLPLGTACSTPNTDSIIARTWRDHQCGGGIEGGPLPFFYSRFYPRRKPWCVCLFLWSLFSCLITSDGEPHSVKKTLRLFFFFSNAYRYVCSYLSLHEIFILMLTLILILIHPFFLLYAIYYMLLLTHVPRDKRPHSLGDSVAVAPLSTSEPLSTVRPRTPSSPPEVGRAIPISLPPPLPPQPSIVRV